MLLHAASSTNADRIRRCQRHSNHCNRMLYRLMRGKMSYVRNGQVGLSI
jgi:hypothetical protein